MENLRPYPLEEFQNTFSKTEIYQRLSQDFDRLFFEKFYFERPKNSVRWDFGQRLFFLPSFYYLQFLLEKNPKQIIDLGCGWNIFKKYIPNVVGIGAEPQDSDLFFGDIHDIVDDIYVQGHQDFFESVFSICSLHFYPVDQFAKRVNDFYSMIKPGGRGFLSLNAQRMVERGTITFESSQEADKFFRQELATKCSHIKFVVVDIDFEPNINNNTANNFVSGIDEGMDGNIRLVMEK